MHVCHLITRLDVGGSSEDTLLLATRLPQPEFAVSLIAGPALDPIPEAAALLARHQVPFAACPALQRAVAPWQDLRALGDLVRQLRALRPDIVHTHTSKAGFIGRLAARLAGILRIVHTPHGHVFGGYYATATTRAFIALERLAARVTQKIVVLTAAEAAQHLAVGVGTPAQFVEIPSGVDLAAVQAQAPARAAIRAALGLSDATPVVGSVARLVPVKGFQHLLAAVPAILRRCPETHVVLAGDGEDRTPLEAQARSLGIGDRVHFLGYRSDPAAVTAALDVFVLPSLNEGQARALVAAMGLGVPVVATQVGGIPDVVRHGKDGLLVPPGDAQPLSRAITDLLRNRERARGLARAAVQTAERFSLRTMLDRHMALYRTLLAAPLAA